MFFYDNRYIFYVLLEFCSILMITLLEYWSTWKYLHDIVRIFFAEIEENRKSILLYPFIPLGR